MNKLLKERENKNLIHSYGRFDVDIVKGKGAKCWDSEGKERIDFTSGIGVNCLGYCDDEWVAAVSKQAQTLQHTSNLFYTEPMVDLAEALTARTGLSKVFFCNSGAESNECAIKIARKYGNAISNDTKNKIITLRNAFHGRTMATLTATGQDHYHQNFFPFLGGFEYCPADDIETFHKILDSAKGEVCAVMLELIQGEGGVKTIGKEFVQEIYKCCKEDDMLLIVDEVQTGVGRTGTFFCYEQYDVVPDIVTFAKGIGGGLPLGGTLVCEKLGDVLGPGDHGTTFGGNPIVCAGANVVMKRLSEEFLAEVREKADYLRAQLAAIPQVKDLSGLGMMIGFKLEGYDSLEFVNKAMDAGLMLLTAKDRIRLLPPLIISKEEIDAGIAIIKKCI